VFQQLYIRQNPAPLKLLDFVEPNKKFGSPNKGATAIKKGLIEVGPEWEAIGIVRANVHCHKF
jgi:hypothetical protein